MAFDSTNVHNCVSIKGVLIYHYNETYCTIYLLNQIANQLHRKSVTACSLVDSCRSGGTKLYYQSIGLLNINLVIDYLPYR